MFCISSGGGDLPDDAFDEEGGGDDRSEGDGASAGSSHGRHESDNKEAWSDL